MNPSGSPFPGMIATSLLLGLVIALFLPLRPWLRGALGSQWLCLLWLVLLVRLLVPWPLETRLGLMNRWRSQSIPVTDSAAPWKVKLSFPGNAALKAPASQVPSPPGRSAAATIHADLPFTVWLCGLTASLALLGWRAWQTRRLAVATLPAKDDRLLAIYSSIPGQWRRNVALRMTRALDVPTLAGLFRPQIWMPQGWLAQFTDEELRGILLHELGHARRGDLAVQWLFAFAQCLHWFNPLVWLAARAARLDREMACDAWVLARNGPGASPTYGTALLKTARLLSVHPGPPISRLASSPTVAMASSRRSLHARIAGIGAFRPARPWPGLLGIALMITALALLTTSAATGGQMPANPATASRPSQPAASGSPSPSPGGAGVEMRIEAKFVAIEEAAFRKLCAEDPAFQGIAPDARFPELKQAPKTYAVIQAELNDLRSGAWELKKGAWETTSPIEFILHMPPKQTERMLRSLDRTPGTDLLSAPAVTMHMGLRAMIEIVREYRYPSAYEPYDKSPTGISPTEFATKDLGESLEIDAHDYSEGRITMDLTPTVSSYLGFLQEKDGVKTVVKRTEHGSFWRPIFSTSQGAIKADVRPKDTILLGGVRIDDSANQLDFTKALSTADGDIRGGKMETARRIILVFITPEIIASNGLPPAGVAQAGATPEPSPTKDPGLPEAVPVNGKAGFVTSPYAPDAGQIDVRGFPKGTEVSDPYSGKVFLVP